MRRCSLNKRVWKVEVITSRKQTCTYSNLNRFYISVFTKNLHKLGNGDVILFWLFVHFISLLRVRTCEYTCRQKSMDYVFDKFTESNEWSMDELLFNDHVNIISVVHLVNELWMMNWMNWWYVQWRQLPKKNSPALDPNTFWYVDQHGIHSMGHAAH